MKITKKQIEDGHRSYQFYLNNMLGSFYTSLFDAIEHADNNNLKLIALGFPGMVYAYADFVGKLPYLDFEEVDE